MPGNNGTGPLGRGQYTGGGWWRCGGLDTSIPAGRGERRRGKGCGMGFARNDNISAISADSGPIQRLLDLEERVASLLRPRFTCLR